MPHDHGSVQQRDSALAGLLSALVLSCASTQAESPRPTPQVTTVSVSHQDVDVYDVVPDDHEARDATYTDAAVAIPPPDALLSFGDSIAYQCGRNGALPCCTQSANLQNNGIQLSYVNSTVPPDEATWSHMLSALTWSADAGVFYSVQDNRPHVVQLSPTQDWSAFDGGFVDAALGSYGALEGIVPVRGGFLISHDGIRQGDAECCPAVFASGTNGVSADAGFALPAHYRNIAENSGFEALAQSPDGRYLFVAIERPLPGDHAIRILRIDRRRGALRESAYSLGIPNELQGDNGVSDMAALSSRHLLLLERRYTRGIGNVVRIFLVDFESAPDVLHTEPLPENVPVVRRQLILDLASLPRDAAPAYPGQQHSLLGNYEGMALGPCMNDGRRAVVLVTDNNWEWAGERGRPQAHRILVLGAQGL